MSVHWAYSEREHGNRFFEAVLETMEDGGNIVAFAMGRTQAVLYKLNLHAESGGLKGLKVLVDRSMAVSTGEIYSRHPECFNAETRHLIEMEDDPLAFPGISYTSI
jgi:metallo-beta-lactamase family protein